MRVSPPATARPETYEQLAVLVARRAAAQEALEHEIRALLGEGRSWTDIGRVLGVSRQGARQRYHRLRVGDGSRGPVARASRIGQGVGHAALAEIGPVGQASRAEVDPLGKSLSPS